MQPLHAHSAARAAALVSSSAGFEVPVDVVAQGVADPAALAVLIEADAGSKPGGVQLSAALAHSPSGARVALLERHAVPALPDVALRLVLSGAVRQRYSASAAAALMQPAQGGADALSGLAGAARAGTWAVQFTVHDAAAFAGSLRVAIDFDYVPADGAGGVQCMCDCPEAPLEFVAAVSAPSLCSPLYPPDAARPCSAAPVQGFTQREVACARAATGDPAELSECAASDCGISGEVRWQLEGMQGTSAVLPAGCAFLRDCGAAHAYNAGPWGACSAACWDKAVGAPRPLQARDVSCRVADAASGASVRAPALECTAAGAPDEPAATRVCNVELCPRGACQVRRTSCLPRMPRARLRQQRSAHAPQAGRLRCQLSTLLYCVRTMPGHLIGADHVPTQ
jgi:hypothetical protein